MNDLIESALSKDLNFIESCINVDEIIQYLNKLDTIKYLLDKERRFKENAVKFATLHVETLVRIATLGGAAEITNTRVRKTAEWLTTLTDEERNGYIARCADGVTIDYIWKKEIEEPRLAEEKEQKNIEKAQSAVRRAISEVKTHGIVDTAEVVKEINTLLPDNPQLANDIALGMRNRLLLSGAVGVGFDSGLYINPIPEYSRGDDIRSNDAEYWRNIRMAIMNRFNSIRCDLKKLHSIIEQSKINLEYSDFISDSSISRESIDFYALSITLMLADMGLIDKESLEDKLDRSFQYKRSPFHRADTDGCKNGREYFLKSLSENMKLEMELQTDREDLEKRHLEYQTNLPTEEQKQEAIKQEGLKIKNCRKESGLTQQELAEKVGVTSDYLSMVECGKKRASSELLQKIFDVKNNVREVRE